MSIQCMTRVWKHSQHKGSGLLLMLALADFADDNGRNAFPSLTTLAEKTRMSKRQVRRLLRQLEASDELSTDFNSGTAGQNTYVITLPDRAAGSNECTVEGSEVSDSENSEQPDRKSEQTGGDILSGGRQCPGGEDTGVRGGRTRVSPNPSVEPSEEPSVSDVLKKLSSIEELKDPGFLVQAHAAFAADPDFPIQATEQDLHNVIALAVHCLKGRESSAPDTRSVRGTAIRNPVAVFVKRLKAGDFDQLTNAEEDAARRLLKQFRNPQSKLRNPRDGPASLGEVLDSFNRESQTSVGMTNDQNPMTKPETQISKPKDNHAA